MWSHEFKQFVEDETLITDILHLHEKTLPKMHLGSFDAHNSLLIIRYHPNFHIIALLLNKRGSF